jgi:cytochrome bd ubiquinol oxidase subunit I
VKGLNAFPPDRWPDNIPLLYFSYHIMVGLGTIFIAVMALAALELWRGRSITRAPAVAVDADAAVPLHRQHRRLDHGRSRRQPWLIYGLMRTPAGVSPHVSAGNALFTLIGFMGMYTMLAILFCCSCIARSRGARRAAV